MHAQTNTKQRWIEALLLVFASRTVPNKSLPSHAMACTNAVVSWTVGFFVEVVPVARSPSDPQLASTGAAARIDCLLECLPASGPRPALKWGKHTGNGNLCCHVLSRLWCRHRK